MVERPNRAVLNDALDEYRDAMRPFIVRGMRRVRGKTLEDAICESLSPNQVSQFNRNLRNSDSIEDAIDIGDFPNLVRRNWRHIFSQQFGDDMNVQNLLYLITQARNKVSHPSTEDLDTEYTRVALYHIVEVLGKINAPEAKKRVEEYREKLFKFEPPQLPPNEPPEVILPNIEVPQDTFEEAELAANLQRVDGNAVTSPSPDPRLRSGSRRKEKYTAYFQELIDQLREQHNFTRARVGQAQNWYCFSSGVSGIYYEAKFAGNHKVYAELYINFEDYAENKNFFDVLKERESEITAQFDIPLNWERRDETRYSAIRLIRDGDINADQSELAAIKAWHIAYLLKLKAVFTPEIQRARETLTEQLQSTSDTRVNTVGELEKAQTDERANSTQAINDLTQPGSEKYEHPGKPLNTPIIRDILNALGPSEASLPVSAFLEIITQYHLENGGEPTQLKDFRTTTYDILCAMEAEGRAERYRDAGRDYWKLLTDNSGVDKTDAVPVSDTVSEVATESDCSQSRFGRLLRSLSSPFSRSKMK